MDVQEDKLLGKKENPIVHYFIFYLSSILILIYLIQIVQLGVHSEFILYRKLHEEDSMMVIIKKEVGKIFESD